jgi:plasmid stabilization system protein ParE
MPFPRILPAAEADILAVRATTLSDYGPAKLAEYDELLEDALEVLTENPRAGRHRPEIAPSAWIFRKARHPAPVLVPDTRRRPRGSS